MMRIFVFLGILAVLMAASCRRDEHVGPLSPIPLDGRLDTTPYNPTAYTIVSPRGYPSMVIPSSNPTTEEGIKLGRLLFYDSTLSSNYTISCGSCHQLHKAFTDGRPTAVGVPGTPSNRNSMSLINVGFNFKPNRLYNFTWSGKFYQLEDQILAPVEHPLEMANHWDTVIQRLQHHPHYPLLFRKAFGITYTSEIDKHLVARAIAQFMRTLNSADSDYDKSQWQPFFYLSDAAQRGKDMFLGDVVANPGVKDAQCGHCHNFTRNSALFARNNFSNNGLDSVASLNDFPDKGYGEITGNVSNNGQFREVTLRNIALTAPYMHDGRFTTLEQVLDHYTQDVRPAPNLGIELATDTFLQSLTPQEKSDIIEFLHALTDTSYFNKTEWMNPFSQSSNPWN